jgi:hypothetical protein
VLWWAARCTCGVADNTPPRAPTATESWSSRCASRGNRASAWWPIWAIWTRPGGWDGGRRRKARRGPRRRRNCLMRAPRWESTGHRLHQFGVWNAVAVAAQVRVHHRHMPTGQQRMDAPYGLQRTAVGAGGVLLRLQIGREHRSEHQQCRRLHDTNFDRGDGQRSQLPVRLGNIHPPNGRRSRRAALEFPRQFTQPPLPPVRLDVLEPLPVYTRRTPVDAAAVVGQGQNDLAVHLVIQGVEPVAPIATGPSDPVPGRDLHPQKNSAFSGRTRKSG